MFGTCRRNVRSEDLVEKIISPVLLDTNRPFKCYVSYERIVYRSFLNINLSVSVSYAVDSGAPAARRAAKRSPKSIHIWKSKKTHQ